MSPPRYCTGCWGTVQSVSYLVDSVLSTTEGTFQELSIMPRRVEAVGRPEVVGARKFAECEPSRIIPSVQGNDLGIVELSANMMLVLI